MLSSGWIVRIREGRACQICELSYTIEDIFRLAISGATYVQLFLRSVWRNAERGVSGPRTPAVGAGGRCTDLRGCLCRAGQARFHARLSPAYRRLRRGET